MKKSVIQVIIALTASVVSFVLLFFLAVYTIINLTDVLPDPFSSIFAQLSDAEYIPSLFFGIILLVLDCLLWYRVCNKTTALRAAALILLQPIWYSVMICTMNVNSIPIYTAAQVVIQILNSGIL